VKLQLRYDRQLHRQDKVLLRLAELGLQMHEKPSHSIAACTNHNNLGSSISSSQSQMHQSRNHCSTSSFLFSVVTIKKPAIYGGTRVSKTKNPLHASSAYSYATIVPITLPHLQKTVPTPKNAAHAISKTITITINRKNNPLSAFFQREHLASYCTMPV
jgi:hypothetical protein